MTRVVWKFIFRVIMASFIAGSAASARSAQLQSLAESNTAFAFDLYGRLKSRPGNLFFSPYSISTALAMTYAGARGETEKQMARVFHFSEGPQIHSAFSQLQSQLSEAGKQNSLELNIANALWAQEGHSFLPPFLKVAQGDYQANVKEADFVTGAEAARGTINDWVAQQTKDKIRDILPPGSLTPLTRLVLANAIYFKGLWEKPYDKGETSMQPFHFSTTQQAEVPLMHHFDNVKYMEESTFQAVEFPYKNGQLAMVVLLPRQVDGCESLEKRLNLALLSNTLRQMRQRKVEIFLPRFKVESSFQLSELLAQMGMSEAFGSKADFSGMDGQRFLYLSGVFHKAWGEVNEEGTEAAAATVGTVAASAVMKPPPPPPVFRADHPFIFFIRDTSSGSILFLGRLADPAHTAAPE